jgi:hypothetical protein
MTDESAHHISAEGLAALDAELHALETEGRRAIAERIKTAREWANLKENAEYHEAKDAQAHLETKILRLRGPAPPRRLRGAGRGGRCAFRGRFSYTPPPRLTRFLQAGRTLSAAC